MTSLSDASRETTMWHPLGSRLRRRIVVVPTAMQLTKVSYFTMNIELPLHPGITISLVESDAT